MISLYREGYSKTNSSKKRLPFSDVLIGGAFLLGVGLIVVVFSAGILCDEVVVWSRPGGRS